MKNAKLLTLLVSTCLILVLAVLPFTAACAQPSPTPTPTSEPIKLRMVTFLPGPDPVNTPIWMFIDKVAEKSNGQIIIEHAGGPEAIGMFEQANAVKAGTIDMAFNVALFYVGLVPAGRVLGLSQYSPVEERGKGISDLVRDVHIEAGLYYFGRYSPATHYFWFMTKQKYNSIHDLAGKKIGPGTVTKHFIEAIDIVAVTMPDIELYTALERGVIDGITWPILTAVQFNMYEVVKYMFNWPFGMGGEGVLMNLDKWNSLPKHLQDAMMEAQIEVDREWPVLYEEMEGEAVQTFIDNGVEVIEVPESDKAYFEKLLYDSEWAGLLKTAPELAEWRDILSK